MLSNNFLQPIYLISYRQSLQSLRIRFPFQISFHILMHSSFTHLWAKYPLCKHRIRTIPIQNYKIPKMATKPQNPLSLPSPIDYLKLPFLAPSNPLSIFWLCLPALSPSPVGIETSYNPKLLKSAFIPALSFILDS